MYEFQLFYEQIDLAVFKDKSTILSSGEKGEKTEYSRLSLSRTRLSRVTAYLEVKIWSLFSHRELPKGNKILWKRGEIAP